jgi:hypothetical protein
VNPTYVAGGVNRVVHILRPGSAVVTLCGKTARDLVAGKWPVKGHEPPDGPTCMRCAGRAMQRIWSVR